MFGTLFWKSLFCMLGTFQFADIRSVSASQTLRGSVQPKTPTSNKISGQSRYSSRHAQGTAEPHSICHSCVVLYSDNDQQLFTYDPHRKTFREGLA